MGDEGSGAGTPSAARDARVPNRFVRQVLAHYAKPHTSKGMALILMDWSFYFGSLAGVLWFPAWWEKVAASLFLGFTISNLFGLGHELAHGAVVRQRWLNRLFAILCFAPGLINYRMWLFDHNLQHHIRSNIREARNSWTPLTPGEFRALPSYRKLLHRMYRAPLGLGLGLGYFLERWQHVDFFPRGDYLPKHLRPAAWRHLAGLVVYLAAYVTFLATASRFAPVGPITAILLGFVVPFFIFMSLLGFAVFAQHTHPDAPWVEAEVQDRMLPVARVTTRWIFPSWFTFLTHNAMDHVVHHWNPRIPCYRAGEASDRLGELLGNELITERFTVSRLNDVLRRCKLYDYEARRWLDFNGRPTTDTAAPFETEPSQPLEALQVA